MIMVQLSIKLWFIQYNHCSFYLLKLFFGNHKDCSHLNQLIILYYITNTIKLLFSVSSFQNISTLVLQATLQQDVNWVIPDVQGEFRKDRWTRDQVTIIHWIIEKARNPRKKKKKKSTSPSLTELKPLIVWITTNCETSHFSIVQF